VFRCSNAPLAQLLLLLLSLLLLTTTTTTTTINCTTTAAATTLPAQDKRSRNLLRDCEDTVAIDIPLGAAVKSLWADECIQRTWARRSEFQVVESMAFFLDDMDRIMAKGYAATEQDMLHVRIRSSGIVVDRYTIDGSAFEMYDVGGQRNERKKWIHCFDNVTAVIYVIAMSEFDQGLFEDASTNRMVEAIELFREICHNPYFERSSIILFLNKKDLFEQKLRTTDIASVSHFSDYAGKPGSYEQGLQYFLNKFLVMSACSPGGSAKSLYHHVTCATDTDNVSVVFNSCKDTILRNNLQNSGFI
jgi:G-protein alpha subunit